MTAEAQHLNGRPDSLLSAGEVAEMLGVSPGAVCLMARKRELPAIRLGPFWRFRRSSLEAWIAAWERQARWSTVHTIRTHLNAHILPHLGDLHAGDVIPADIERLIARMTADGLAPKTVRNVVGTLHALLGLAVARGIIDRNPAEHVPLPRSHAEKPIRFLTMPELERLLAAAPPTIDQKTPKAEAGAVKGTALSGVDRCEGMAAPMCHPGDSRPPGQGQSLEEAWWPVLRLLILTAAMTGMRLGELRALRWSDLDMAAMKVRVTRSYVRGQYGQPKSRRSSRAIPIASRLVSELEAHHRSTVWHQDTNLVLAHPHTGRPLPEKQLLQHFRAALTRANVRPVRIHDLRHTFATTVAVSGDVSLRTLQEWMGHASFATTQIYADYMPGEREQQQLDQAFGGTGEKTEAERNWR